MFFKAVVAVCLCFTTAAALRHNNFYRRDYTYLEEYDAFYKFHLDDGETSWIDGFIKCDDEGAQLFYPTNEEWRVAANMTESMVDVEYIYVGIRDEFGRGNYVTIDGHFIPDLSEKTSGSLPGPKCVIMSVKTGAFTTSSCEIRRSFICKKLNNEYCPTADSGYIFSKSVRKCFKVNEYEKTWENAMHTCIMEGGILAESIVNTDITHLNLARRPNSLYYVGYRRIFNNDYFSGRGRKMTIYEGQDDGTCTAIDPSNSIRTVQCEQLRPFVCEMEVNQ